MVPKVVLLSVVKRGYRAVASIRAATNTQSVIVCTFAALAFTALLLLKSASVAMQVEAHKYLEFSI